MGGRLKRQETYVDLQPIHVVIRQKLIQHHKAIIFQLKITNKKKLLTFKKKKGREMSISDKSIFLSYTRFPKPSSHHFCLYINPQEDAQCPCESEQELKACLLFGPTALTTLLRAAILGP